MSQSTSHKNTPNHVAIIMDGNGRWASNHGKDRLHGHNSGVSSVREVLTSAQKHGVKYLTLYTFSTENWNRPKDEVDGLMNLFAKTIATEIEELHENKVRIQFIGDTELLPDFAKEALNSASEYTKNNTGITLILALSYSSRVEILNAAKQISSKVKSGELNEDEITDEVFSNHLTTAGIPDPELIIRTSGEYRISNFLLWQIAYSEFYFTETLWPDFREKDFELAIESFQNRERRFGKTGQQIKQLHS
ncbi:MAG: isoprenyl transferase [Flavobacteriales bacterium]